MLGNFKKINILRILWFGIGSHGIVLVDRMIRTLIAIHMAKIDQAEVNKANPLFYVDNVCKWMCCQCVIFVSVMLVLSWFARASKHTIAWSKTSIRLAIWITSMQTIFHWKTFEIVTWFWTMIMGRGKICLNSPKTSIGKPNLNFGYKCKS